MVSPDPLLFSPEGAWLRQTRERDGRCKSDGGCVRWTEEWEGKEGWWEREREGEDRGEEV